MCSLEKAWLGLSLMWCLIGFESLEKCLGIYNSNDCKCLAEQTIKIYPPRPSQKFLRQECKRKPEAVPADKSHSLWIPKWKEIELRKLIGNKLIFLLSGTHAAKFVIAFPQFRWKTMMCKTFRLPHHQSFWGSSLSQLEGQATAGQWSFCLDSRPDPCEALKTET